MTDKYGSETEYQAAMLAQLREKRYALDQSSLIKDLEEYAQYQFSHPTAYDQECNMHLLKHYQLEPLQTNVDIVVGILAKGLTRLPDTDFMLATFLVTEVSQQLEPVAAILQLGSFLESAKFQEFWQSLAQSRAVVASIVGFEDAVRKFIFHVVESSYRSISKELLSEFVNLPVPELNTLVATKEWRVTVDSYTVPQSESTEITAPPIERIQLSQLFPILSHLK